MLSEHQLQEIARFVAEQVQRNSALAIEGCILGVAAQVVTSAVVNPPVRPTTSPNGDSITEAAVWIGVPADQQTADKAIWCMVRRGLTLNEGDVVRVVRNSPGSRDWFVDAKL